jgi:hypothetical protein
MVAAMRQTPEIHGPPAYYTTDWDAARASVERLAELAPLAVGTGHGRPMRGEAMLAGLRLLAENFETLAVPRDGRYVRSPAVTDETGVVSVPPPVRDRFPALVALGAAAAVGVAMGLARRRRR